MIINLTPSNDYGDFIYNGFLISVMEDNKRNYWNYKIGNTDAMTEQKLLQMRVLAVLEQSGFPMNEIGTYLYKDIIIKTMHYLSGLDAFGKSVDEDELLRELKYPYSQFYFDISRNEMDIGLKTFHSHIEHAVANINYQQVDPEVIFDIYGDKINNIDYGENAVLMAKYINKTQKHSGYQYAIMPSLSASTNI